MQHIHALDQDYNKHEVNNNFSAENKDPHLNHQSDSKLVGSVENDSDDDGCEYDELILIDHGRVTFNTSSFLQIPLMLSTSTSDSTNAESIDSNLDLSAGQEKTLVPECEAGNQQQEKRENELLLVKNILNSDDLDLETEIHVIQSGGGVSSSSDQAFNDLGDLCMKKRELEEHLQKCQKQIVNTRIRVLQERWNQLNAEEQALNNDTHFEIIEKLSTLEQKRKSSENVARLTRDLMMRQCEIEYDSSCRQIDFQFQDSKNRIRRFLAENCIIHAVDFFDVFCEGKRTIEDDIRETYKDIKRHRWHPIPYPYYARSTELSSPPVAETETVSHNANLQPSTMYSPPNYPITLPPPEFLLMEYPLV